MTTFREAVNRERLFEVVIFDERITTDKQQFIDSVLGFWESVYEGNINIGDDIEDSFQEQIFDPYKEKLDSAILDIKSLPKSVEDVPIKWIIDIDPWTEASTGNFDSLKKNLDDFLEYLDTLKEEDIADNENEDEELNLDDEENLEDDENFI